MKKVITLCLILISLISNAQFLTLDELLNVTNNKLTTTTEMLMNKKWKLTKTDKQMSDDNTLIFEETAVWNYTNNVGSILTQLEYYKELNLKTDEPLNFGKYFIDVHCSFASLDYYNNLNQSIKLKKWPLKEDDNIGASENQSGTIYKSYMSDKYFVALAITVVNGQQIYFIRIHRREGIEK